MTQPRSTTTKYIRHPELDMRISRGDDAAGDAWEVVDATVNGDGFTARRIVYTAVNYDPNVKAVGK